MEVFRVCAHGTRRAQLSGQTRATRNRHPDCRGWPADCEQHERPALALRRRREPRHVAPPGRRRTTGPYVAQAPLATS